MPKYKIIPIQHLLRNNQIAKSGQIVDGKLFVNLQDSLDRGFCKLVKDKKKKKKDKKEELTESQKTIKHLESLNKEPLIEWCKDKEFTVDKSLSKPDLLASIIEQVKAGFEDK